MTPLLFSRPFLFRPARIALTLVFALFLLTALPVAAEPRDDGEIYPETRLQLQYLADGAVRSRLTVRMIREDGESDPDVGLEHFSLTDSSDKEILPLAEGTGRKEFYLNEARFHIQTEEWVFEQEADGEPESLYYAFFEPPLARDLFLMEFYDEDGRLYEEELDATAARIVPPELEEGGVWIEETEQGYQVYYPLPLMKEEEASEEKLVRTRSDRITRQALSLTREPALDSTLAAPILDPALANPILDNPTVDPTLADPVLDNPTVDPALADPVLDNPTVDPALADPVLDNPTVDPALADPVLDNPTVDPAIDPNQDIDRGDYQDDYQDAIDDINQGDYQDIVEDIDQILDPDAPEPDDAAGDEEQAESELAYRLVFRKYEGEILRRIVLLEPPLDRDNVRLPRKLQEALEADESKDVFWRIFAELAVVDPETGEGTVVRRSASSFWPPENQPPEAPFAAWPLNNEILGTDYVTLSIKGDYTDSEDDALVAVHYRVRELGGYYWEESLPVSFSARVDAGDLFSHRVEELIPGMAYAWQAAYEDEEFDEEAGRLNWSEESIFIIGEKQVDESLVAGPGKRAADFRMISIVQWPRNADGPGMFNASIREYDTTLYRIGRYDPLIGDYREYGEGMNIRPGRAMWFFAREETRLRIDGVPVTLDRPIRVPLNYDPGLPDGWNQIAPPNAADYDWLEINVLQSGQDGYEYIGRIGDLEVDNPWIDTRLWRWESGEYRKDTRIMSQRNGYWVQALRTDLFLEFTSEARVSGEKMQTLKAGPKKKTVLARLLKSAAHAAGDDGPPPPPAGFYASGSSSVDSGGGGCFLNAMSSRTGE